MFLTIHTTNSTFEARDDGHEYNDVADARKAAILACSDIAVAELGAGKEAISVVAALLHRDGTEAGRLVVSVSVSDLVTHPHQPTLRQTTVCPSQSRGASKAVLAAPGG